MRAGEGFGLNCQLRIYDIEPGQLERFVSEWRDVIVPLRRQFGFRVVGAWTEVDADRFVWIVAHDGDFAAADAEYYGSPERTNLDPSPARLILNADLRMLRPV